MKYDHKLMQNDELKDGSVFRVLLLVGAGAVLAFMAFRFVLLANDTSNTAPQPPFHDTNEAHRNTAMPIADVTYRPFNKAYKPAATRPDLLPVESCGPILCSNFNARIEDAARSGERWMNDPIRVARKFIASEGASFVGIVRQDHEGENPTRTTVIIVEDGWLDDSFRGAWHRILLVGAGYGGPWIIDEAQVAYRGWRKVSTNAFNIEPFRSWLTPGSSARNVKAGQKPEESLRNAAM